MFYNFDLYSYTEPLSRDMSGVQSKTKIKARGIG